jgi:cytochrome P450
VFTAGHETTKNLISSCVLILLKHPEILAQVRENPGLIDRVVEETLRLEGPVQRTARVLREEMELHGQRVPCGAKIRLMIGAANRDPRHFDNPDQFDIARSDKQHLGFGGGIHHCIGLRLGRLETSIAIGAIFQRFPGLKLVNEECRWGISTKLRGLSELIVQT